ncbi:MAG: arylesterase [Gammaproteobacteria bacterium]
MFIRLLLLTTLLWTSAAWAAKPVILVLGDSLSAGYGVATGKGWVALLAQRLQDEHYDYRVVNASISGNTTRSGVARLPAALHAYQPQVVVIELGGNDGLQGLTIPQMRDNLAQAIEDARRAGARVLLTGVRLPPNYGPAYNQRFHAVYQELAHRYRTAYVPYLLAGVDDKPALMQDDGIHPNAAGQPRILDNVWPHLAPLLQRSRTTARQPG